MSATQMDGPIHISGDTAQILDSAGQGQADSVAVPDPNTDAGPSLFFQGMGVLDPRFTYLKDKVTGYSGMVPSHLSNPFIVSINQIPVAINLNIIAGAQTLTSGTAMTLAVASLGWTTNVPISPMVGYGGLNSQTVVTTAGAIDFGFGFCTTVAGNAQITVSNSNLYRVGMPLVIGEAGNAAGTSPLLTNVESIDSATLITLADTPLASVAVAPVGTGNLWGPSEVGFPTPTAALPYLARGPGLFFDARQGVNRALSISGLGAGALGGTFTAIGYDVFGQYLSEVITVGAGIAVGYSRKCFKYLVSVTPNFTDPDTYSVGTTDVFGFACRMDLVPFIFATWNALQVVDGVGFAVADQTSPATTTTDDVRGVIQVGSGGPHTPITNANASNGTQAALVMSGRRLLLAQWLQTDNDLAALSTDTRSMFGVTQA